MNLPAETSLRTSIHNPTTEDARPHSSNTPTYNTSNSTPADIEAALLLQAISTNTTFASRNQKTATTLDRLKELYPRLRYGSAEDVQIFANMEMAVYNDILSHARARHPTLRPNTIETETFTMEDVYDALDITSLHTGRAITLEKLLGAVARPIPEIGVGMEYNTLKLLQAIRFLWRVDFARLVAERDAAPCSSTELAAEVIEETEDEGARSSFSSAASVEYGEDVMEETQDQDEQVSMVVEGQAAVRGETNLDQRPRRVSPRQKSHDALQYTSRYHPMDEVLRPGRVSKLRGSRGKGKSG